MERASRSTAAIAARDGGLRIELRGNLAAMLSAAQKATRSPETGDVELQRAMVAGARNRRYLQLWRQPSDFTPESNLFTVGEMGL